MPASGVEAGTAFPWQAAMVAGLGRLSLAPAAFWAMTPRELLAALGPPRMAGGAAPSRAALDRLMHRFPDQKG